MYTQIFNWELTYFDCQQTHGQTCSEFYLKWHTNIVVNIESWLLYKVNKRRSDGTLEDQ